MNSGPFDDELRDALDSGNKNLAGLGQTRTAGNVLILMVRPQEVVASIQALAQAYNDYYGATADYNRAEFRLYHVLGNPAQELTHGLPPCPKIEQPPAAATTALDRPRAMFGAIEPVDPH